MKDCRKSSRSFWSRARSDGGWKRASWTAFDAASSRGRIRCDRADEVEEAGAVRRILRADDRDRDGEVVVVLHEREPRGDAEVGERAGVRGRRLAGAVEEVQDAAPRREEPGPVEAKPPAVVGVRLAARLGDDLAAAEGERVREARHAELGAEHGRARCRAPARAGASPSARGPAAGGAASPRRGGRSSARGCPRRRGPRSGSRSASAASLSHVPRGEISRSEPSLTLNVSARPRASTSGRKSGRKAPASVKGANSSSTVSPRGASPSPAGRWPPAGPSGRGAAPAAARRHVTATLPAASISTGVSTAPACSGAVRCSIMLRCDADRWRSASRNVAAAAIRRSPARPGPRPARGPG